MKTKRDDSMIWCLVEVLRPDYLEHEDELIYDTVMISGLPWRLLQRARDTEPGLTPTTVTGRFAFLGLMLELFRPLAHEHGLEPVTVVEIHDTIMLEDKDQTPEGRRQAAAEFAKIADDGGIPRQEMAEIVDAINAMTWQFPKGQELRDRLRAYGRMMGEVRRRRRGG